MTARFPGYDVLKKRWTQSWNDVTRDVVDRRLAVHPGPRFFTAAEWQTLEAVCDRILPQPPTRPAIPLAAYVDEKLHANKLDGYRYAGVLPQGEAWKVGLGALDEAAQRLKGARFHQLGAIDRDDLLRQMQHGKLDGPAWRGMSARLFFEKRVIHDVTMAYYAHPTAWSEIGFGGPASPRGYVRLDADRRDPWEAAEARPGNEARARRDNNHVV